MKTLLTIPMLVAIVATGILSCNLFQESKYGVSALLTVASFLTCTALVAFLNSRKAIVQ